MNVDRIGLFAIGNVLTGDDAFGPTLLRVLESKYVFPDRVSLRDMGTPGLGFVNDVLDTDALVVLDTVRAKGNPGDVLRVDRAALLKDPPRERIGPHDPSLKEALLSADVVGHGPRSVTLVGVIPGSLETGVGLSPGVEAALPEAEEKVLDELRQLGVDVIARDEQLPVDLWWLG